MNLDSLNQALYDYDLDFFTRLEPVLKKISVKSKALSSNLKDCIIRLQNSDRYLKAYQGEEISTKEAQLKGEEFDIFRKYVRLLRSCTIMCGHEASKEFKDLFFEFFSGKRLQLALQLHGSN